MNLAATLGDPTRKDVVTAVLGASAALGGFVLVFLGVLIGAYQTYPADTVKAVKSRRRRAIWPVLLVFLGSLVCLALALAWLAVPGGVCLYHWVVWTFVTELAAIFGVAVYTTRRMLG